MARYDSSNADIHILSFKDGMLAKLAHDLKMKVERFTITVDEEKKHIDASFDARSVKVVCRRKNGEDDPSGLNALEIATIHSNIEGDVLESKKFQDIRFVSTSITPEGEGYRIVGDLTLHGKTKSLTTVAKRKNGRFEAEVKLHQPDFGIKPYSAMMGALKVQADVIVTVSVPAI